MSGPLLLTQARSRLNRHAATRIVNRLAKGAGITKHISPHSLRHSFITAALDAGVPLRDVQIAAGHSDPRTTTRYNRARTRPGPDAKGRASDDDAMRINTSNSVSDPCG